MEIEWGVVVPKTLRDSAKGWTVAVDTRFTAKQDRTYIDLVFEDTQHIGIAACITGHPTPDEVQTVLTLAKLRYGLETPDAN